MQFIAFQEFRNVPAGCNAANCAHLGKWALEFFLSRGGGYLQGPMVEKTLQDSQSIAMYMEIYPAPNL